MTGILTLVVVVCVLGVIDLAWEAADSVPRKPR